MYVQHVKYTCTCTRTFACPFTHATLAHKHVHVSWRVQAHQFDHRNTCNLRVHVKVRGEFPDIGLLKFLCARSRSRIFSCSPKQNFAVCHRCGPPFLWLVAVSYIFCRIRVQHVLNQAHIACSMKQLWVTLHTLTPAFPLRAAQV